MAKQRSTIALNIGLFAFLFFTLHFFQAQGEGTVAGAWGPTAGGGQADTAEFVLLEPIPAATVGAVNATDPDTQVCLQCNCCLKNTNPQVCLTTCCYQRISGNQKPQVVSCGCNHCVPPSFSA